MQRPDALDITLRLSSLVSFGRRGHANFATAIALTIILISLDNSFPLQNAIIVLKSFEIFILVTGFTISKYFHMSCMFVLVIFSSCKLIL